MWTQVESTHEQTAKPLLPITANVVISSGGGVGIVRGGGYGKRMMALLLLARPLKQTTEQLANSFSHGSANEPAHLQHRVQKQEAKKTCLWTELIIVGRTVQNQGYEIRKIGCLWTRPFG